MAKLAKRTHAEKPTTSRKKKESLRIEYGGTGTKNYRGFINEEYNSKLVGTLGVAVFDEMRKSDGTVKAGVQAVSLPVLSAKWYIESASEDKADTDITAFVMKALFELQDISWSYILRHALMSLPLGVMAFEKVFDVVNVDGTERIVWKKLAPRLPSSIQRWAIANDEPGITQRLGDGKTCEIPMEKLVVIVHEMEGENWWGTSILRAPYKHWFMKNTFYKIDAIAFERQGLGVPYGKLPPGASKEDVDTLTPILKNMRANSQGYAVVPDGYELGFLDMKANTTRDPATSIAHHNREIMKSMLAQFLELGGDSQTGSKAVSQDHSELFMQSLQSVADTIASAFNTYAIKELVDLNFPNVQKYPVLKCPELKEKDVAALTNAYKTLVDTGTVLPTDNDEQYFRNLMGLPERDPKSEPRAKEETEDIDADLDMSEFNAGLKKKVYPERSEIARRIQASIKGVPTQDAIKLVKERIARTEVQSMHKQFYNLVKAELTSTLNTLRRIALSDDPDFKGHRPLTFAEKKVDFNALQKQMDKLEDQYTGTTKELLHNARTQFIKSFAKAADAGDTQAIKDLTLKVKKDLARITKGALNTAYTVGKNSGAKELGVNAPATARVILQNIDVSADSIAEAQIAEIVADAKSAYTQATQKGVSSAAAIAAADRAAEEAIDALVDDTADIVMSGYINHGRNDLFDLNGPDIYALQRSEMLDHATCDFCLSVDERVIEKEDEFGQNTIFHSGCRGIWVAIKMDEEELPSIGGIPKSIRDRFGETVNDLIQPRNPQTKKDSLARKEVERRLKRKAE